jgi:hypothetical protein
MGSGLAGRTLAMGGPASRVRDSGSGLATPIRTTVSQPPTPRLGGNTCEASLAVLSRQDYWSSRLLHATSLPVNHDQVVARAGDGLGVDADRRDICLFEPYREVHEFNKAGVLPVWGGR